MLEAATFVVIIPLSSREREKKIEGKKSSMVVSTELDCTTNIYKKARKTFICKRGLLTPSDS